RLTWNGGGAAIIWQPHTAALKRYTSPPTIMACATCLITTAASRRKYPWGGGHCGCATMCCIHGDPVLAVYSQVGLHWRARMVPWTASSDLWLPVERSRRPLHGSSPIPHWAKSIMRTADGQRCTWSVLTDYFTFWITAICI